MAGVSETAFSLGRRSTGLGFWMYASPFWGCEGGPEGDWADIVKRVMDVVGGLVSL